MIEFLQRILIGHNHKWTIERTVDVKEDGALLASKRILVLQCSICGSMKNHTIQG